MRGRGLARFLIASCSLGRHPISLPFLFHPSFRSRLAHITRAVRLEGKEGEPCFFCLLFFASLLGAKRAFCQGEALGPCCLVSPPSHHTAECNAACARHLDVVPSVVRQTARSSFCRSSPREASAERTAALSMVSKQATFLDPLPLTAATAPASAAACATANYSRRRSACRFEAEGRSATAPSLPCSEAGLEA